MVKRLSDLTPEESVTLEQLSKGIKTSAGGTVRIYGEGIKPNTWIGLGVAEFLAKIPDNGVTEEDMAGKKLRTDWIREYLLPNRLVEERGGSFHRTEAANRASYSLRRNEPAGRGTYFGL